MNEEEINSKEMTLRDYFAAKAIQTILYDKNMPGTMKILAEFAYDVADAMIEARK